MTISEFIQKTAKSYTNSLIVKYLHPTLYIICHDSNFASTTTEEREKIFLSKTEISASLLEHIRQNPIVQIELCTPEEAEEDYEFIHNTDAGQHWLSAFNPLIDKPHHAIDSKDGEPRAIHFYGYKGGQARSTVLLALAKMLADSEFNVLVVDADIEAPSLDAMLGVAADDINSTIMGLYGFQNEINPIANAYVGNTNAGRVDLLASRPAASNFDMDFAAFLLNASLDARVLEQAIQNLKRKLSLNNKNNTPDTTIYDIVLFDHRTGLAPSVLPIMEAWPGPAVIFVRPDGMARHIYDSRLLDSLLSYDLDAPGAFVSFSLDPKQTTSTARETHGQVIERLLEKVSDALTADSFNDENFDIDPAELERYWVFWRHDQALIDGAQFTTASMHPENRQALLQLRGVLGLSARPKDKALNPGAILSNSGSSDQGLFILTPDIAKLFSTDSPYTYIFGRKGTGKTRLLTELSQRGLGQPLLVANDSKEGGLASAQPLFNQMLAACNRNFELFWWSLLDLAQSIESTRGQELETIVNKSLKTGYFKDLSLETLIDRIVQNSTNQSSKRVFLIDGIETAVPASDLREFVESLFRFLSAIQYERTLSRAITTRLFLRSDLKKGANQNIEQQTEGHSLNLHWNKTAILNFALARIASLSWFKENFKSVCDKIINKQDEISRGALPDDIAESFLLEIFPKGLERNKVKTTTFFATYFSDAGGDSSKNASFYPRLFDGFLRTLAKDCEQAEIKVNPEDRLPSPITLIAYDKASTSFIDEVRIELHSFLNIEPDNNKNKDAVDNLLQGFIGLSTPFVLEETIKALADRTHIPSDKVRQALGSMKLIGIFEERTGYPGEWRTGRLYKAGLDMKYVRRPRQTDNH